MQQAASPTTRRRGSPGALICGAIAAVVLIGAIVYSRDAVAATGKDRLLATGQVVGYRGNFGDRGDGNRDDGDLIRGRLFEYEFRGSKPASTQLDNVVLDLQTGLMWIRDIGLLSEADESGPHGNVVLSRLMSWDDALNAAEELEYAGYSDWHLPTFAELHTLVNYGSMDPAFDDVAFGDPLGSVVNRYIWSSTTLPTDEASAYYVNLFDGHGYFWTKDGEFVAWPVRRHEVDDPVAVLATGQVESYSPGDDADRGSYPAATFEYRDDGVFDQPRENMAVAKDTGLRWIRDLSLVDGSTGIGGNVRLDEAVDWQTAIERCNELSYGGYNDWRLPNIRELGSIMQVGHPAGPVDTAAFPAPLPDGPSPDVEPIWWSSTTSISTHTEGLPGQKAWFYTAAHPTSLQHVGLTYVPAKSRPGFARCVCDDSRAYPDPLFLEEVRSLADYESVTLPSSRPEVLRRGKFLLAAEGASAPFESAFQDVGRHALHYDFLRAAFPEAYGALTVDDYIAMVSRRATRAFFAGGIRSFADRSGDTVYGFDVYIGSPDDDELLSAAETAEVYRRLSRAFRRRPFVYSPVEPAAIERALGWDEPNLPVGFPSAPPDPGYEAYTTGEAYGTITLKTVSELPSSDDASLLSRQHILVLDQAPSDLDGVVSALITGSRQADLSHLAIRTARRGTPNAYVLDSHAAFREFDGQLVRLSVGRDGYHLSSDVTVEEAERWWASRRPEPVSIPAVDTDFGSFPDFSAIAESDADGQAATRVGAKAANLAKAFEIVPERHQVAGVAIPFKYWADFMSQNAIFDQRSSPPVARPLDEYVKSLQDDAQFVSDPAYRAQVLADLRDVIDDDSEPPSGLEDQLAQRIAEVFGAGTMVRFRSSSNAEDGLIFSGAGLYDSTSVCVEDSLDGDGIGPSKCDPNQPKERTIARGLKRVWASLYSFGAWEEREHFGIDHSLAAMAILVTPAFPDERANGVAFTGNPVDPDALVYVVNVQQGDTSVVLPDPGVLPERDLLVIDDGAVVGINRVQSSSLLPAGSHVLSDAELATLGDVLIDLDDEFPISPSTEHEGDVMLDVEFKIRREDDELIVKQVRPFLSELQQAESGLRLIVPDEVKLCATWRDSESLRSVLERKLQVAINPGTYYLSLESDDATHDLFGDLLYGADLEPATPIGPGRLVVTSQLHAEISQQYDTGDATLSVVLRAAYLRRGEVNTRSLTPLELMRWDLYSYSQVDESGAMQRLLPCRFPSADVFRLEVDFESQQRAELDVHMGSPVATPVGSQLAELVRSEVDLSEGAAEIGEYGQLVYSASRHNWLEQYWALFDPPLGDAHGLGVYQHGAYDTAEDYTAELLDSDLNTLRPIEIVRVQRRKIGVTPEPPESLRFAAFLPALARRPTDWSAATEPRRGHR